MTQTKKQLKEKAEFKNRAYKAKAERRKYEGEYIRKLKSLYRELEYRCQLKTDSLPSSPKELLESLALPKDFKKIIDYLSFCSGKTKRIAEKSLKLWNVMDTQTYIKIMKQCFFDESGDLKGKNIDKLFSEFYEVLLKESQRIKREEQEWIPWEKVRDRLDKKLAN